MGDARETFDRLTEAINRHDLQAVAACYSPDTVMTSPDGRYEGREAAQAYLGAFLGAFPDFHVTSWSKLTSGDVGVDEWTMTATHTGPLPMPDGTTMPPTGRSVSLRGCDVAVVEDGLITSHRLYYDQLDFLAQLGVVPEGAASA